MKRVALPRLQVIVLAAGFSSRLGEPKALARVRGSSLLTKTLQCAAALHPARIVAVVPRNSPRYRSQARGIKVTFADNSARHRGLSSSVRRGITAARYASGVLLIPVDLVNLKTRELARLVKRWRGAPRCVVARRIRAAAASFGAAPLVLPRCFYERALRVSGDIGLRELIAQLPPENRMLIDIPSAATDIDTPEDLRAARRSFRSRN